MVKTEMLQMLRNDLIHHPAGQISKANLAKIRADYESKPYETLSEEELELVCTLRLHLLAGMKILYFQCLGLGAVQVLFHTVKY